MVCTAVYRGISDIVIPIRNLVVEQGLKFVREYRLGMVAARGGGEATSPRYSTLLPNSRRFTPFMSKTTCI